MTDKVILNRIELWGNVGVLESEKNGRQRYWITIEIETDLREAGRTDRLEATIDYGQVFELARDTLEQCSGDLIEGYAERLAEAIFRRFSRANQASIRVLKPDAPIVGKFESVGIQIERARDG
ncbi:MAG: dihydroneopterin aldolase [Opitutales bacterium TMED158]|nr:MAG: dihydroneopterin aldolase [Opitutales bacterium TMED158]